LTIHMIFSIGSISRIHKLDKTKSTRLSVKTQIKSKNPTKTASTNRVDQIRNENHVHRVKSVLRIFRNSPNHMDIIKNKQASTRLLTFCMNLRSNLQDLEDLHNVIKVKLLEIFITNNIFYLLHTCLQNSKSLIKPKKLTITL
jgi:hypothetical protein